jgi:dinuclear metal center YbgI/SA1388 family protein
MTRTAAKPATAGDIRAAVDAVAPFRLAEKWDSVGLQVGAESAPGDRVLVALEASADVVAEARRRKCNVLLVHHPLIFRERKTFAEVDPVSRLANELIRAGISLIAAHTNLDSTANGTNGVLADLLGLAPERRFLRPAAPEAELAHFAVYVPHGHESKVIDAIAAGGGGAIGNYSHCTYRVEGTGTFKPLAGANPFLGKVGALEQAAEARIECVVPVRGAERLLASVRAAHPYEEMAYVLVPMLAHGAPRHGLGLAGVLPDAPTLGALADRAKKALRIPAVQLVGDPGRKVRKVALCTGAGGEFVRTGAYGEADLFVTGEMSHHDAWEARERGLAVLLVGHFASEAIVCPRLAQDTAAVLKSRGRTAKFTVSTAERDPLAAG